MWRGHPARDSSARSRRHVLPGDSRRVAPQILQAIKAALVAVKDVDHNLEVIEHDPLARRKTVDRCGAPALIFSQPCFNFVRDRFQLRLGTGRANHEVIGEAGNSGEIEDNDVFRLFVRSELGASRG